jgi:hypothetical protein
MWKEMRHLGKKNGRRRDIWDMTVKGDETFR